MILALILWFVCGLYAIYLDYQDTKPQDWSE